MRLHEFMKCKPPGSATVFAGDVIPPKTPDLLPRTIFMFWDKGFDDAPELVRFCVESWRTLNPAWDLVLLDDKAANRVLDRGTLPPGIIVAHYADMLRTRVLRDRGGVWADATLLCLRPLDDWLPAIFNQSEFFVFYRPGPDRVISNWLLASSRASDIVSRWYSASEEFWKGEFAPRPYYWHHYVFEYLLRTDESFEQAFAAMPRLSAEPPHLLQKCLAAGELTDADLRRIRCTGVQKLNHKSDTGLRDVREALGRLSLFPTERSVPGRHGGSIS